MASRINSLQVLRFLAAAMVAGLHIEQHGRSLDGLSIYGGWLSNVGTFGVDVFFVLSGFIIAKTAVGKTPGEFLWLRLTRVVPYYWLLTAAFLPFAGHAAGFTWGSLLATFTFYPELGLPVPAVAWTLFSEILFGLPAACLVFAALQVQARRGWLSQLGDASYSLYLIHPIIIVALTLLSPGAPSHPFMAVAFCTSILAAAAAHSWLEQPLIAALRRPRRVIATV